VDVVALVVVVLVVVDVGQPPVHASQQLAQAPTVPPFAVQAPAVFTVWHVMPCVLMRQQVTKLGRPHVDLAAHLTTALLHSLGRGPWSAAARATPATHET
jgi:hypothetical protein